MLNFDNTMASVKLVYLGLHYLNFLVRACEKENDEFIVNIPLTFVNSVGRQAAHL